MIGRTLRNRYEVRTLIGEGSTATVYKALDKRLNREVALKILLPNMREAARRRFFQEATAVAHLNHPNIMAIYDMDEERGQHFLVVEFVEGESLTHYIPSRPEVVVELGKQIAQALDYAHKRQVIHRDIKPANIKVTPDGLIKIMDLGLALPREAKRVTADGMIIGTPAYLSPEQAQALKLDYRTDIYSLGVVLYEMATGELPFASDDIPALLMQHVKQPPPPLRNIKPDLPLALESVILKSLEKQPDRRFQSGEAFAQALDASIRTESSVDAPTQSANPIEGVVPDTGPLLRLPLRLIIADDHTILRRTLVSFLAARDELMIVGEAGDGETALQQTLALSPDVLLLDLNMPNRSGLEILPDIRTRAPQTKALVLTGRDEDWYVMQALRAGAHGYLLKSVQETDLIDGIMKVAQGHLVLGHGVAEKVVTGVVGARPDAIQLAEQERQILLLIAAGFENSSIAERLKLTLPVLIETLAQAMDKLNAKDRHEAALTALRQGYILLDELQTLEAK
ncbi:MAG: protein kinase [Chloroflexi bacterium]|nr:protein kinase [Chloroflexota bacterium]